MYDGGANLVAYRVWVRPFSATDADPSDLASQVFSETFFFGEDISNPENPSTWHHLQRSSWKHVSMFLPEFVTFSRWLVGSWPREAQQWSTTSWDPHRGFGSFYRTWLGHKDHADSCKVLTKPISTHCLNTLHILVQKCTYVFQTVLENLHVDNAIWSIGLVSFATMEQVTFVVWLPSMQLVKLVLPRLMLCR